MARRTWGWAAKVGAGIAAVLATAATSATASATPFVGTITACSDTVGSVVAVNFAGADVSPYGVSDAWGGPVALGCDTSDPAHGINLLTDTGFTTAGDQHDGPAFICRIGSPLFDSGTQYPTPAQDPCVITPPASAYWSYWLADAGQDTWTYSPLGVDSDVPKTGEVEAWTFGGTNIAGTTGQPPFTPEDVRAQEATTGTTPGPGQGGGGGGSGTGTSTTTSAPAPTAPVPAAHTTAPQALSADESKAAHYLVTTAGANGLVHGTSLARAGYYEAAARFADFGLTIDGAFALVAADQQSAALRRIITFIAGAHRDGSHRSINSWTEIGTPEADGGSIGKEALFAEVVGRNPRHFAGHNLITALNRSVCTRTSRGNCAGGAGSFHYGSSTFDQTLAIMAMVRAGDGGHAGRAIRYLERDQHRSGAWPSLIPSTGDSDVDSTAMAAMTLALLPHSAAAANDERRALAWIAGRQEHDGGFPGAAGDSTNSAALAIQALELGGSRYSTQLGRARAFLIGEQNADGGFAIAATGPRTSDVRASTQVLGGLIGTSFGTLRLQ